METLDLKLVELTESDLDAVAGGEGKITIQVQDSNVQGSFNRENPDCNGNGTVIVISDGNIILGPNL